jgi:hypothetical protein
VLAAWLVLRTSPQIWHRLWLLVGVLTMQLMDYDGEALRPVTWHTPQLIWDAAWLGILLISSYSAGKALLVRLDAHSRPTPLRQANPTVPDF